MVEKCLQYGDSAECERIIDEILAQPDDGDNLLVREKFVINFLREKSIC